eukprot:TRINITY_DN2422_c0_g1_i1.p2 TRINITY_DN2422_c0_g1~~TRINITY_DN2422_c0_g1_i1.p2  ORF type:complete len:183 (+),score=66.04 TRINITY_DN2422_c0_g1_i1:39-587(+)
MAAAPPPFALRGHFAGAMPPLDDVDEEIVLRVAGCRLVAREAPVATGECVITASHLVFLPDAALGESAIGVRVHFKSISMHAIATDVAVSSAPCIYMHVEDPDAADENDGLGGTCDMMIVPADPAAVEALFAAMSEGAARHPDEVQEGEGDFQWDPPSGGNGGDDTDMSRFDSMIDTNGFAE